MSEVCNECHSTIQHDYRGACVTCLRRELDRLREDRERFLDGCIKLSAALSEIDALTLPPEKVAADIEAVGGPLTVYDVSYEERLVVDHVADHIKRLRAIVDKLDKTRDGVPIVRSDRVYAVVNDDGDHWRGWLVVTGIEPMPGGRVLLIGDDGEGEAYADECYSTREAAEAAGGDDG